MAAKAALAVLLLLAPTLATANFRGWTYKKPYTNVCKKYPCTSNPSGYKPPKPYPAKPDPKDSSKLVCQPGYIYVPTLTGYTTPQCVPCESGFYSPGGRSTRCLSCGSGAGFITPQGAASASQCVCIAGFGGPGCKQCAPGTFSTGGRPGIDPQPPCQVCPEGSKGSTTAGAISSLQCGGCLPGYGGSACSLCRAGTWSAGGSYAACTRCGPFQTSRPGSPGADYCVCAAGYGSTDGAACTICPVGSFWPGAPVDALAADAAVIAAAAAKKKATLTACLPCKDANEAGEFLTLTRGAKSEAACVCKAGYGGSLCSICPQGTWSAGGSTAPCTACGGLGTTDAEGATSVTQCGCQAGYGGSKCERCPADTYSTGGTQSECQPCPVNTQAPVGSQSAAACVPKPGFGIVGSAVVPCPVNTWSAGGVNGPCTDCPAGTVSPSGSSSSAACVCQPGYKVAAVGCVQCARGEVCPGGAAGGAPKSCPPGATSDVGSDSPADCVCLPGYGGGDCDLCPEGYFSAGGSLAGCQKCGLGQTSPAGSINSTACVCLAGRGGASCSLCPTGTYSAGGSTAACDTCPTGTTTTSTGNDDPSDCVCQPGFAGPFCTACKAGEMCPGGTRLAPVVCPANAEAPAGATTVQQCVCKAGFGRPSGAPLSCTTCPICEACPVGTWSAGNTTDSCKPCGRTETTATVGSESAAQCVCQPGFGGADCAICPAGTYSTGYTEAPCTACPGNSTSAPGAKSSTECVCSPGYGGPTCAACPAGTYSAGGSKTDPNAACVASLCPGGQAANVTGCACKPGFGGGSATAACTQCPPGTYGPGGSYDACLSCGFGLTSAVGSNAEEDCVQSSVKCPAGMLAPPGTVSVEGCICLDGFGYDATSKTCKICPAGTYALVDEEPGLSQCLPCPFGTTSAAGKTGAVSCVALSSACPVGMYLPNNTAAAEASCVCKPGYGGNLAATACFECPAGTYSDGSSREPCKSCPFGTTSAIGAVGLAACVQTTVACPAGQIAPVGAVSKDQCGCAPGTGIVFAGQTASPTCQVCPVGTYSPGGAVGGVLQQCQPCSFGFTSAAGSFDVSACYQADQCPPGTYLPSGSGSSAAECVCRPGYGGSATGAYCTQCPVGTYSGEGREGCKLCPFGTTSPAGSDSIADCTPVARSCPIGMAALPGAASSADCACLPGYGFATANPSDGCALCPVGTFSDITPVDGELGSNSGTCKPCPFGFTSQVGSVDQVTGCYPVPVGTLCPPGMEIPAGVTGASTADCQCRAGFGSPSPCSNCTACALCPSGFFSAGGTRDVCQPCPFGSTSPQGSDSAADCVALPAGAECPPGQMASYSPDQLIVDPDTPVVGAAQCHCYPGFGWTGSVADGKCEVCPVGTFSAGVINAPCFPCGFGMTSPIGSIDATDCYPVNQCPMGMTGPTGNVTSNPPSSAAECVCLAGYGASADGSVCYQCPAGTYGEGNNREPCVSCGFGFTSGVGVSDPASCQEVTQKCPPGQFAPLSAVSAAQCGCLPGYGGGTTPQSACTVCPVGTYAPGGDTQPCRLCSPGFTSPTGSINAADCFYNANICPPGMVLPDNINGTTSATPGACVCQPGFGSTESGCTQCLAGFYSTGGVNPCSACPTGTSSPPGAVGIAGCTVACDQGFYLSGSVCRACPAGTSTPALPPFPPTAASDCTVCAAGYGTLNGGGSACGACASGFYSTGGSLVPCQQCPTGTFTNNLQGQSFCVCQPGFGVAADNVTCTRCAQGFYSAVAQPLVSGLVSCTSCGVGYTTDTGTTAPVATTQADCICAAGYGAPSINGTRTCEACVSPLFQGGISGTSGSVVTSASASNPFPVCSTCAGGGPNTPTGDINGKCTAGTQRPSATCSAGCTPFTRTCNYTAGATSARIVNFTLPGALQSAMAVISGAQGSPGRGYSITGQGNTQNTQIQPAGLGGRISVDSLQNVAGFTSGSTVWIVAGKAAQQPTTTGSVINFAYAGGGGGYSAILSSSDPSSATWYASAGGGGGGGGSNTIGGGIGGAGCVTSNFGVNTVAPGTAAGDGGPSFGTAGAADGRPGLGPNAATNNGTGGTGLVTANNPGGAAGAAGGGGGGGWGFGFGAGGQTSTGSISNQLFSGLAGGYPGGGGGGAMGSAATVALNEFGGTAGGGGGGGFVNAAGGVGSPSDGGRNTATDSGEGGIGGQCQRAIGVVTTGLQAGIQQGDGAVSLTVSANEDFTCPA